jgi:hypothetical protein
VGRHVYPRTVSMSQHYKNPTACWCSTKRTSLSSSHWKLTRHDINDKCLSKIIWNLLLYLFVRKQNCFQFTLCMNVCYIMQISNLVRMTSFLNKLHEVLTLLIGNNQLTVYAKYNHLKKKGKENEKYLRFSLDYMHILVFTTYT